MRPAGISTRNRTWTTNQYIKALERCTVEYTRSYHSGLSACAKLGSPCEASKAMAMTAPYRPGSGKLGALHLRLVYCYSTRPPCYIATKFTGEWRRDVRLWWSWLLVCVSRGRASARKVGAWYVVSMRTCSVDPQATRWACRGPCPA